MLHQGRYLAPFYVREVPRPIFEKSKVTVASNWWRARYSMAVEVKQTCRNPRNKIRRIR